MYVNKTLFVLCVALIKLISGTVYTNKPCSNIQPVQNFDLKQVNDVRLKPENPGDRIVNILLEDMQHVYTNSNQREFMATEKILGVWYEITRYENDMETNARCVNSTYVYNDNTYKYIFNFTLNNEFISFSGPVAIVSQRLGILDYYSSMFKKSENSNDMVVDVVALEADCVVLYYCKYDETKKLSHDYFWVISRDKTYNDKTRAFVENFINDTPYVDRSRLVWQSYTEPSCISD